MSRTLKPITVKYTKPEIVMTCSQEELQTKLEIAFLKAKEEGILMKDLEGIARQILLDNSETVGGIEVVKCKEG